MKRSREAVEMLESLAMAKYLMLFSQGVIKTEQTTTTAHSDPSRVFECKTCNRRFPSFQALGGHRASHKKIRSSMEEEEVDPNSSNAIVVKSKVHECTICGIGFATGQALGGHMRKHKAAMMNESMTNSTFIPVNDDGPRKAPAVLKRSNSSRRVMGLNLNLTPLENDLEWMFGKLAPKIDFKFTTPM